MLSLMIPRRYRRSANPALWDVRATEQLFDDLWSGFDFAPSRAARAGAFAPRVNVHESEEEMVVTAELPGLEEKDFEVSLEEDVLTIKGEKSTRHESQRHVETLSGRFERKLVLPAGIDPDGVKADYRNGVLTVTLPMPPEARPEVRTIPVTNA